MNLYPPKALSIFILYFIQITNLEYGFSLYKGEKKKSDLYWPEITLETFCFLITQSCDCS